MDFLSLVVALKDHLKNIVIVGTGPGAGLGIARRFGKEGFWVALIARRKDALEGSVKDLTSSGVESEAFHADSTDEAQVSNAFGQIHKRLGSVDVLE